MQVAFCGLLLLLPCVPGQTKNSEVVLNRRDPLEIFLVESNFCLIATIFQKSKAACKHSDFI